MGKEYIDRPVRETELQALRALAIAEEANFFARNPHLIEPYRDRLIAVALCQGAALQYLGRGYGVNDFDIHFFYLKNPAKPRLSRTGKSLSATVGNFSTVRVDLYRTLVASEIGPLSQGNRVEMLREFLSNPRTDNAVHLAKKPVIGLIPDDLFRVVIWEAAC